MAAGNAKIALDTGFSRKSGIQLRGGIGLDDNGEISNAFSTLYSDVESNQEGIDNSAIQAKVSGDTKENAKYEQITLFDTPEQSMVSDEVFPYEW